ncbi:MAG: NlpC/P60 family protein [Lachnospiraceae bacterium]|nr:NlpC/P60 family protein [Lachnospiraceae bacterium]
MKNKLVCTLITAFAFTAVAGSGLTGITAFAAEDTAVVSELPEDPEAVNPDDPDADPNTPADPDPEQTEENAPEDPSDQGDTQQTENPEDQPESTGDDGAADNTVTQTEEKKEEQTQKEEKAQEEEQEQTQQEEQAQEEEQVQEEVQEAAAETVAPPMEAIVTISKEELLAIKKQGIYVAFRDAGMSHTGACSVMGVIDNISGFDTDGDGLLKWSGDWKDKLDEYVSNNSFSYAYQTAFLLETLENPETEGQFDTLKTDLMSDESTVSQDVRTFVNDYMDEADPENDLNISTCIETADGYLGTYDSIKDSYSSETSIFDMTESISGQMVADYACQYIGNPYFWGGTSLTQGTDCSGFIQSVYGHFGVSLPHYSGALRSVGYGVSSSELLPGDIICYDGHCAIYIGNGQIVHASNSAAYPIGGIKISDNYNYRPVLAIRRIFDPSVPNIDPVELTVEN